MILLIIMLYLVLKYIFELDREDLYKIMIMFCLVNIAPVAIYALYSLIFGGFNVNILLLMTVV